nr:TetR/AcrR family transcriptional regulator [Gracilibacillus halotolerans]
MLKEKPLEDISITELCRIAKINRGTFYLHYKDVHGVLKDYWETIIADLKESYEEPYYQTNFKIENVQADMIKIFHHVKQYQDFYQIIFSEKTPMFYYYQLFETVHSFVRDSFNKSLTDDNKNLKVEFLISYQTNAILGLLLEWHKQDYETSVELLNEQLIYSIRLGK